MNHFNKHKCKLYEIFFETVLQSNTALHLGNKLQCRKISNVIKSIGEIELLASYPNIVWYLPNLGIYRFPVQVISLCGSI